MAISAHDTRSPVDSSMSISRGAGADEISSANDTRPSVVLPIADSTATTSSPSSRAAAMRPATARILSASATDEPPNFMSLMAMRTSSGRASARF